MKEWSIYLIRCNDGSLYTGISNDVDKRLSHHGGPLGARFTRGKGPFSLEFCREVGSKSLASRLEWRVKRLRRADKERLIGGELDLDRLLEG